LPPEQATATRIPIGDLVGRTRHQNNPLLGPALAFGGVERLLDVSLLVDKRSTQSVTGGPALTKTIRPSRCFPVMTFTDSSRLCSPAIARLIAFKIAESGVVSSNGSAT
jgi:hypothetical protein